MKNMPYIIRHVRGSIEFICLSDSITSVICGWPHENGRGDWSHRTRDNAAYLFYSAALSAALEQYCGIFWTYAELEKIISHWLLAVNTLKLASVYFVYHGTIVFHRKFSTFSFFVETHIKLVFRRKSFVFRRNPFRFSSKLFFVRKVSTKNENLFFIETFLVFVETFFDQK